MSIHLWMALYEHHQDEKIRDIEIRFLATDFTEAYEIAMSSTVNDDDLISLQRISHITGGIGSYKISKINTDQHETSKA